MMNNNSNDRLKTVTSRQNSLVKDLRKAFSQAELTEDGNCAVEGLHIVEEAIRSGLRLKAVFVSESAQQRATGLLPQLSSHTEAILLPDDVFRSAVPSETPQGIAALVKLREFTLDDVLGGENPLVIAAAGLQDPGNLGTMLRSAEAFGATGVFVAEKTVSPLNWKTIRGSAGSLYRLPLVKTSVRDMLAELRQRGIKIAATSSHKGRPLHEIDFSAPTCIVIGNEGAGVPKELLAEADATIVIPHSPKVESLNAGIAASVILYEAARQRASRESRTAD